MNRRDATKGIRRSIAAGSMLWACSAAPAFAATLDAIALDPSYHLRDALLLGSLVLLVSALVLRIRRRREAEAMPTGPDLRWWKTAESVT
jgi:hypothetical protein